MAHSSSVAMEESHSETVVRPWRPTGALPAFSRAFDVFMTSDDDDESTKAKFFVPTYLKSSTYMQKLSDAEEAKVQARKDAKRPTTNKSSSNGVGFTTPSLPPGSHRGLSHTVIERPQAFDEKPELAPLPTRWNSNDMAEGLEMTDNGLGVKFSESRPPHERERDHEAYAVRADFAIPPQLGIYYYEVQILSGKRDDTYIAIGFSTKTPSTSRPVGWEPESWGYHGDDGRCFSGQNIGRAYGPTFSTGDVIGCGINFRDHTAFFTRNGKRIGGAFQEVSKGKIFPSISLKRPSEKIYTNFGQTPFVFNIDDLVKEQRGKLVKQIMDTDTSRLEPGMNETDLIHTLVMQFLQHDGYVETARAFAEDLKVQNDALSSNPTRKPPGINIHDDEDANNRQRIRRAILDGDVDRALKYTNAYYPQVLQENEHVYFKLRCRKFIEMVRRAAQLSLASESASNGQTQEMDIDGAAVDDDSWGDEKIVPASDDELLELEQNMLVYGQTLQTDYAADPRKEVTEALAQIWSLVAYPNPLKEPEVSHLLDRKGRTAVAEELNSAILASLGKSSRASLEKVYAQTSVLLEELRHDGGDGAFISVSDLADEVTEDI